MAILFLVYFTQCHMLTYLRAKVCTWITLLSIVCVYCMCLFAAESESCEIKSTQQYNNERHSTIYFRFALFLPKHSENFRISSFLNSWGPSIWMHTCLCVCEYVRIPTSYLLIFFFWIVSRNLLLSLSLPLTHLFTQVLVQDWLLSIHLV